MIDINDIKKFLQHGVTTIKCPVRQCNTEMSGTAEEIMLKTIEHYGKYHSE